MKPSLIRTVFRSLLWHKKESVYQIIIVALLTAIITGSFFTGRSVRSSLRKTVSEKLGNTDVLASSGLRYFDASLSERITDGTGVKAVSITETDGFCQNFGTGATALNTKIYGTDQDFFTFYGAAPLNIERGTAAVNSKLAQHLDIEPGDEIIVHFRETDPIPENAPFAPSKENSGSVVLKICAVISPARGGNFSLGASQVIPMNIFINAGDINGQSQGRVRANRILIHESPRYKDSSYYEILARKIEPGDIGLSVRKSAKTGESEIISDRIFIDSTIVQEITGLIPSAQPVLTYLANSITISDRTTPYSFITALPASLYGDIPEGEIVFSRWLADDLEAEPDDTVEINWYIPTPGNLLEEKSRSFIINHIEGKDSRYSDPSLMPDFPGISGSTTCSEWDAGIPILLDRIRDKDEEYWNRFRGTPKAFINYKTGKTLWGNNFGSATAIRFPGSMDTSAIRQKLKGRIDPGKTGFTISDLRKSNINAANEGVDFSVLFLSLSIFIIISCLVLLSMALTLFFNSRKNEVNTYYALGFRNNLIRRLLFLETAFMTIIGAFAGIFLGYLINVLIIKALNNVWFGAVQTNTISPVFSLQPLLIGFIISVLITFILLFFKISLFLRHREKSRDDLFKGRSVKGNIISLAGAISGSAICIILSVLPGMPATILSFTGGALLFLSMVLALRFYYVQGIKAKRTVSANYSKLYYSFNPSHAVTPSLFIAAGIFALVVTGANRQELTGKMLLPSGGTGGYLLWAESAMPVKENLNSPGGRKEFGFDEPELKDMRFVQAKRVSGDDASCLNINHVTTPPLLGVDPTAFIQKGSFSIATSLKKAGNSNPWGLLKERPHDNTIYGIADQTVLEWGLKLKTGDTIKYRAENGQPLNIVICAGLRSSLFQGNLIIGDKNLEKYFPSVPGSSVFLIDGNAENAGSYKTALSERLSGYGISVEQAGDKLASFFSVTNTYIEVFMVLGIMGLILGAAGLGLVLIRNFNERKREFAIMIAIGYPVRRIRQVLLKDQIIILSCGIITGVIPAITATWTSLKSGAELPLKRIAFMAIMIFAIGILALLISVRQVRKQNLINQLRRE